MSTDDALVAWYEARDVFLGLNGQRASRFSGRELAEECMTRFPGTCPEDCKWFCTIMPRFTKHITVGTDHVRHIFENVRSMARTTLEEGRALCFSALCEFNVSADVLADAARRGYPLAVGVVVTMDSSDDLVGGRHFEAVAGGSFDSLAANAVTRDAIQRVLEVEPEPRCLY